VAGAIARMAGRGAARLARPAEGPAGPPRGGLLIAARDSQPAISRHPEPSSGDDQSEHTLKDSSLDEFIRGALLRDGTSARRPFSAVCHLSSALRPPPSAGPSSALRRPVRFS